MTSWKGTLEQLVRERRGNLVGYAYLLTGDRAQAEDLTHDAIIRTFARARKLENVFAAEAYVKRVIATQFFNATRSEKVLRDKSHLIASEHTSPEHGSHVADAVTVQEAVMALASRERACIVLRFYEDQTVPEIARTLDIAEGTVKRYLHHATGRLQKMLGEVPGLELSEEERDAAQQSENSDHRRST